jgi:hypothetical protein
MLLMMGGVTTRNILSSLRKDNKLYTVAYCRTIIDTLPKRYEVCSLFGEFAECVYKHPRQLLLSESVAFTIIQFRLLNYCTVFMNNKLRRTAIKSLEL